ncbi:hypothetical protein PCE1_004644 [Barthelona sp. PCE]
MRSKTFILCALVCVLCLISVRADNCDSCKLIVGFAEQYIQGNPNFTQEEAEQVLNGVCAYVKLSEKASCSDLTQVVVQYFPELKAGTPALEICTNAGYC